MKCGMILLLSVPSLAFAEPDTFGLGSGDASVTTLFDSTFMNNSGPNYHPVNSYAQLLEEAQPGSLSVFIGSARGFRPLTGGPHFAAGDLVMLLQMRDDTLALDAGATKTITIPDQSGLGRYEFARLAAVEGPVLTFTKPVITHFAAAVSQVVRVPEVGTARIAGSDVNLTSLPYDGRTGGIIALFASGPFISAGYSGIDLWRPGYRGAPDDGNSQCVGSQSAAVGESFNSAWLPQRTSASVPGGHGGGGAGCVSGAVSFGAGGGGSRGRGGSGGSASQADPGNGGARLSYPLGRRLIMGGGGGASVGNCDGACTGVAGGGIVYLRARAIDRAWISARGQGYDQVRSTAYGAEPGGGGGSIHVRLAEGCVGFMDANGGNGFTSSDQLTSGGGGGGGGIFVRASSRCEPASDARFAVGKAGAGAFDGEGNVDAIDYDYKSEVLRPLPVPVIEHVVIGSLTPTVSGFGAPANVQGDEYRVRIYLDGMPLTYAVVDSTGRFSVVSPPLPAGEHELQARSEHYGLESQASAAEHIVVNACAGPQHCIPEAPLCDAALGLCVQCFQSNDCAENQRGGVCRTDKRCGCEDNSDCPSAAPVCVAAQCRAACVDDIECPSDRPVCGPGGTCGECADGRTAACSGALPFCDIVAQRCRQCLLDSHCATTPAGPLCLANSCGCTNDGECAEDRTCVTQRCEPRAKERTLAAVDDAPERAGVPGCASGSPAWLAMAVIVLCRRRTRERA